MTGIGQLQTYDEPTQSRRSMALWAICVVFLLLAHLPKLPRIPRRICRMEGRFVDL